MGEKEIEMSLKCLKTNSVGEFNSAEFKDFCKRHGVKRQLTTVDYLRFLGCVRHVHIPDAKRSKLEYRSVTCILFGVSSESKGYRMIQLQIKLY